MVDIGVEKHNHCLFSPILYESVLPFPVLVRELISYIFSR
jgi:hypothetical protein